jgi:hypothetical protein
MLELQPVPDYFGQFMAPLQRQQALNLEQQQVQLQQQAAQEKVRALQQAAAAERAYQQDAASVIANPSPEGFRALMLKYPEMHDGLKNAWDQYGEGEKQRDTAAASQVYAALSNGQPELAAQVLKDRKAALASAGQDDKITDSILDMIESGDPQKIKQAQGIAGYALATTAGPEKIGPMLEALGMNGGNKGQVVGRAIGHYENGEFKVDYRDPDAPQYRELDVTGPDGKTHKAIVAVGGDSGTPAGAPGGFEHAVSTVLANEGGYAAKDMNGKPVNFGINQGANPDVDVKNLTRDEAIQLYHDRYWVPSGAAALPANLQTPYFDVYIRNPKLAKKALADSEGDPVKFVQLTSNYFQRLASKPGNEKYAKPYANRDANNLAIAHGGAAPGQPKIVAMGAPTGGDEANPDDAETAKFIGGQVALGQPMPPLGMGKEAAAMRRAILAEATKQWKAMGISPGEANVIAAQNKSGLQELAKIAQMKATVQTAENTASANATQVLTLLGAAGTTGSPIFNRWQQAGRRATGDPKVAAFDVAVKTLATEYARVMSGGNSTQLSDAARHEADALIHTNMTPDQFRAAIRQMKIDMANRSAGIERERQSTLQQIRSGGRASPPKEEDWITLPSGLRVRRIR